MRWEAAAGTRGAHRTFAVLHETYVVQGITRTPSRIGPLFPRRRVTDELDEDVDVDTRSKTRRTDGDRH